MRKKISLVVLSNSGSSVKQLTISTAFLRIFALVCLITLGIFGYDYYLLKIGSIQAQKSEITISSQSDEIVRQRKQIQGFAEEIAGLKAELVELNNFEKKIRIIANIEKTDGQDALFGIGGSIPEDLDTQIPLTQRHNSLLRGMHEQVDQLHMASVNQNQGFVSLFNFLKDQQNLLASTPAVRPCQGWTTSRFGYRKSPFTGRREFHKGYDIANRKGTPIIATADGVVSYVGPKGLLGNMVMIDHGNGWQTLYAHLSQVSVACGQNVTQGQLIGLGGSSGNSTGPHLHFETRFEGGFVNPWYVLP